MYQTIENWNTQFGLTPSCQPESSIFSASSKVIQFPKKWKQKKSKAGKYGFEYPPCRDKFVQIKKKGIGGKMEEGCRG